MQFSTAHDRAENNGWSTDNVRPDRGLDQSNSGFAGHFWIQTFYFPYIGVFLLFALNPSKKKNTAIN